LASLRGKRVVVCSQMVLPAAGARATIRFAQRRAGPNTSAVSAAGQSDVLQVKTASVGVNALIQVHDNMCTMYRTVLPCPHG
jgi:hypothetical protein